MAEFVQTMKDMRRMCDAYASNCDKCPLASYECACTPKHRLYFTDKQVEAIVATWVEEHPEPVYPSVAKYLEQFGITIRRDGSLQADFFKANKPMSADMAKLLGIEPKEVE